MFLMNSLEYHLTIETDGAGQNSVYTNDRKQQNFDNSVFFSITKTTTDAYLVGSQKTGSVS